MGDFSNLVNLTVIGDDRFEAPAAPERTGRMYGGQFLGQSLAAAIATTEERDVHSLHAYFLRAGDVDAPLQIAVERVRDGRSFSARAVRVTQHGKELFRMLASFQIAEPGHDYDGAQMPDVPPPEDVSMTYNEFSRLNGESADWDGEARPMDIRYIDHPEPGDRVVTPQRMWLRIPEALPDDPGVHFAALAYLSDCTLVDSVVLPHGIRWQNPELNGTSLDHAMWFHHRTRADEWLLYDQTVGATGHARGFAQGRLFDRDGRLVASCGQEGMIRW